MLMSGTAKTAKASSIYRVVACASPAFRQRFRQVISTTLEAATIVAFGLSCGILTVE